MQLKQEIWEIALTGGIVLNCTSTPTHTVSVDPVWENLFHNTVGLTVYSVFNGPELILSTIKNLSFRTEEKAQ